MTDDVTIHGTSTRSSTGMYTVRMGSKQTMESLPCSALSTHGLHESRVKKAAEQKERDH